MAANMNKFAETYNEEEKARVHIWKYVFGFTEMAVVKCAVDLGIPDILENHRSGGSCMTLAELSAALGCSPSSLYRIMRFLTHRGIFKEVKKTDKQDSAVAYAQTALSRLLMKNRMAPFFEISTSPEVTSSLVNMAKFLRSKNGEHSSAFEVAHQGMDTWQYMEENRCFGELFNRAMACLASSHIPTVIQHCSTVLEGIRCLVDVGGGNGTNLRAVVKACPWIIRAVNFDLPRVVSSNASNGEDRVEYVGGDMFVSIPIRADAVSLVSVLHNWDDDACVKILKNCKEAIPEKTGKVIIVDCVIEDDNVNHGNEEYRGAQLAMDMSMLCHMIKGKQRTAKEWAEIFHAAGFSNHTIKRIPSPQSVIIAYP